MSKRRRRPQQTAQEPKVTLAVPEVHIITPVKVEFTLVPLDGEVDITPERQSDMIVVFDSYLRSAHGLTVLDADLLSFQRMILKQPENDGEQASKGSKPA